MKERSSQSKSAELNIESGKVRSPLGNHHSYRGEGRGQWSIQRVLADSYRLSKYLTLYGKARSEQLPKKSHDYLVVRGLFGLNYRIIELLNGKLL
ncbi:MAG: hypothetical protein Kow006_02700 [Gammaproteobacteria bacterium]